MISLTTYLVLHLSSIIVLLGYTFYAFAAPAETRKRVLMITGIAAVLVLVTGFGMLHRLHLGFPGWAIVKLVCLPRPRGRRGLRLPQAGAGRPVHDLAFALAITAVAMVYVRPF